MEDLLQAVVRSPAEKTADPKVVDATRREAARRLIGARALMKGDDERAALALGALLLGGARADPMAPRRDMMPRRSDVILKSVEIHPGWRSGCDNDCNSTLSTAAAFSATRIDWTFLDPSSAKTAAFLRDAGAAGLPVSAAINANMPDRPECEDELNCTKVGRVQDLFGRALTLPWMTHWQNPPMYEAGAAGCVNAPEYERIKYKYIDSLLAAGVSGFIHDDWTMNTDFSRDKQTLNSSDGGSVSFASGCFCKHCMRGFTEYLRGGNASSVTPAELSRLNISSADWSYKEHALHELSSCPHAHPHSHSAPPSGCASAADNEQLSTAFDEFQRDSTGLHLARMMAHIRAEEKKLGIGRVAVACNGDTTKAGDLQAARESTGLSQFDYGMKEYRSDGSLGDLHALVRTFWQAESIRKAQVLTLPKRSCEASPYKAADTALIRESIAVSYSAGGHMIIPWDNSLSTSVSCPGRYWGKTDWYADLYHFVRAQAALLDGFEHAPSAGGAYGDMSGPTAVAVRANSSGTIVLVRTPTHPAAGHAIGVVHLVRTTSARVAKPGVYTNSDCAGHDIGRPLMVTSLGRCEQYCRRVEGCHGFVLGGVAREIKARCGATPGATPRQYCCLPKATCANIQPKDDDTAVALSGGPAGGGASVLELRFRDGWWNASAAQPLDIALQTPVNRTASGVTSLPLRGRRVGGETVVAVELGSLDPWGMLVVRRMGL